MILRGNVIFFRSILCGIYLKKNKFLHVLFVYFFVVRLRLAVVGDADGLGEPEFSDDDRVGDDHDEHGHEEHHDNERRVVDALAGLGGATAAVLVLDNLDGPVEIVTVGLHIVGPVDLYERAVEIARRRDGQAEHPDGDHAHDGARARRVPLERVHDGHEAIARDGHQCPHARHYARYLQVRVELAEQLAEYPQAVDTSHHFDPHARDEYEQVADGQVEHEVVGRLGQHEAIRAYDHDDEAVANQGDEHDDHVQGHAHKVDTEHAGRVGRVTVSHARHAHVDHAQAGAYLLRRQHHRLLLSGALERR